MVPQRRLRETAAASTGLEDGLAAPRSPDSLAEIERSLTKVTTAEERAQFRARVAQRAGVDISAGATWALVRIDEHGFARARAIAEEEGIDPGRIAEVVDELRQRGLVAGEDGAGELTDAGREHTTRLVSARRQLLVEALADDTAHRSSELTALLERLARELSGEPPSKAAA